MNQRSPTIGLLNINQRIKFISGREPITCERCRNIYLVLLISGSPDFNDFGLRHCPFCGRISDPQGNDFFNE